MFKIFYNLLYISLLWSVFVVNIYYAQSAERKWFFEKYEPFDAPNDIVFFDKNLEKCYLEDYEGKTLLVFFWATWSSASVQEMMELDILQKDFRKLPFEVIAISEDYGGIDKIKDFYSTHDIRHLGVFHDYKNHLFNAFSVIGVPSSFIITQDGLNVGTFKGAINWYDDDVRNVLLSYISGNPSEPKNTHKANFIINSNSNSGKDNGQRKEIKE